MKLDELIEEMKIELFACGILESELEDAHLKMIVKKATRELERYWDETTLITVPYASCIDLSGLDYCSIKNVYRAVGIGGPEDTSPGMIDPVWAQQWMVFSNLGTMYNLQDYILNYAAWNTMSQIRNTMSTDLGWDQQIHDNKLYLNGTTHPDMITIEYIPKIKDVDQIKSVYWIDLLVRFCVAHSKVALGRARTRAKQSGALWEQDGDKLLEEGNAELEKLREQLSVNDSLCDPID